MRQVFIDTETTGFSVSAGHRLVEVAAVEVVDGVRTGREFHARLDPERPVPEEAVAVHGLSNAILVGSPRFAEIAPLWVAFVRGAEALAHSAAFDARHLTAELRRAGQPDLEDLCALTDTLRLARAWNKDVANHKLDTLLAEYGVDASPRAEGHGALIDARLLADLYAAMCLRHEGSLPRRRPGP